jgi:hypothetical protein
MEGEAEAASRSTPRPPGPTIKDGLIVHLRSFSTWKEALEAAGLRE